MTSQEYIRWLRTSVGTSSYHLYVDDSGSRQPDHSPPARNDGMDHFAVGGILIRAEDVADTEHRLTLLRDKYGISAPFHSTKMRGMKGAWSWLGDKKEEDRTSGLMKDLSAFIKEFPGNATACVVHRPGYVERYSQYAKHERWRLCKSAYALLIERATKIAHRDGRKLAVYVEQSGVVEDRSIKAYHQALRDGGMIFNPDTSAKYGPLTQDVLTATLLKNPNFFGKEHLMGQLADLVLYPLVKGKYAPNYPPYKTLKDAKKIADDDLANGDVNLGVKYYCFNT